MDVGLLIMDEDTAVAIDIAKHSDRVGVHSVWTIDYYNRASLVRAAAFAAVTENALVGTSVTPAFAISAVPLSASVADIQRASAGRFVLGLGSSTRRMNRDWYGVDLDHPAPRFIERIELIRRLLEHPGGPFEHHGRFEDITMAHLDHAEALPYATPIFTAGVGPAMTAACGAVSDGFVGHPIASVDYLESMRPRIAEGARRRGRDVDSIKILSQIIAVVDDDRERARRIAAVQVAFYSTVKGYDSLFLDGIHAAERQAAREAFAAGDLNGMAAAGMPMVEERAVFGPADEVAQQLKRYEGVVDLALLYPPHYGIDAAEMSRNERALAELAAAT